MTITARSILLLLIALPLLYSPAHAGDVLSYSTHAQQLIDKGDYEKAVDELRSALALNPYDQTLRRSLAAAYAQMGQRDLKQTRYREAAEDFAQAKELFPESRDFTMMRGVALYRDKNYDAARAEFEQAGDEFQPLVFLGKISYDTGDLPAAIGFWKRAREKNADDTAVASLLAKAERELPVESKMDKGYSSMFDLSFDAEIPQGLSAQVLDALESAYNSVGSDLGLFPTSRVPVLLYTKSDYSSVTATPDWSGGVYDGKIRLPVGGVTAVSPQMRGIIFHEYTHVVISRLTGGNIPTWLNEGLAEIEGRREHNRTVADLSSALKKDQLLSLPKLSGPFISMKRNEASVAYEQSYSVASFMVSRYGWFTIQEILKSLGERNNMETATAKALSNWSLDLPGVLREWRESLK